jgi:serine protease Do
MIIRHFTNHSVSLKWLIKSFLPIIFGTLLISVFFFGCGQQDVNKPIGYINLNRVGDKACHATVYIEVINQKETVEPLTSFTADPIFLRYFDVDKLQRKFSNELVGQGTGMIIDEQGNILTNNHVVRGAAMIDVRLDNGRWCAAKLIGTDPKTNLAVIRIFDQVALPLVIFGDSNNLTVGEPVATVGYMGENARVPKAKVNPNRIRGYNQVRSTEWNYLYCSVCPDFWLTDAGNNSGNSGALLLNRQG